MVERIVLVSVDDCLDLLREVEGGVESIRAEVFTNPTGFDDSSHSHRDSQRGHLLSDSIAKLYGLIYNILELYIVFHRQPARPHEQVVLVRQLSEGSGQKL